MVQALRFGQLALLSVLAVVPFAASANELFLDLNSDAAQARFDATHHSRFDYSLALLISDEDDFDSTVLSAGMWTKGKALVEDALEGGLGFKLYHIDTDYEDVQALSLGGNLSFDIKQVEGLRIDLDLYYAPDILITDDLDNLWDMTLRVHYQLFENGSVYGGFRNLEVGNDGGPDADISDGPIIGIQLSL